MILPEFICRFIDMPVKILVGNIHQICQANSKIYMKEKSDNNQDTSKEIQGGGICPVKYQDLI